MSDDRWQFYNYYRSLQNKRIVFTRFICLPEYFGVIVLIIWCVYRTWCSMDNAETGSNLNKPTSKEDIPLISKSYSESSFLTWVLFINNSFWFYTKFHQIYQIPEDFTSTNVIFQFLHMIYYQCHGKSNWHLDIEFA